MSLRFEAMRKEGKYNRRESNRSQLELRRDLYYIQPGKIRYSFVLLRFVAQ